MAYCLGSLVRILEHILHPDQHHQSWRLDPDRIPQIQSLLEKASFLRDFLADSSPPVIQARIETLEDRIRDAAENAEDVLETHVTDRILSNRWDQSLSISPPDLQKVIEEFETAKEEMMKIMEVSSVPSSLEIIPDAKMGRSGPTGQLTGNMAPAVLSGRDSNPKEFLVGLTKDFNQLRDRLTSQESALEIIPIVGMGGIGKTTLAGRIYDEYSFNRSHFDTCAWATISQDCDFRNILLRLLRCIIGKHTDETLQMEDDLLGVTLHKSLVGRRYLIVLDDIWSPKAWDVVQMFFPKENNGSRIILTTRESHVANYVDSRSSHHQMRLLGEVDSWRLLREKVYGKESCPLELRGLGKIIANNCGGLPLAIQVVGGLLSQAERNKDYWIYVADNISSFIANENDQISGIFSLSYAHLPHYLKPCFLYMAAFPKHYEIRPSRLVSLWVAEGFLKPIGGKSLEEAAKVYLKALVDRNLIFVHERKNTGEVKSYGIHDLLKDLCLRKASHKKFLQVMDWQMYNFSEDAFGWRRVSIHLSCEFRDTHVSKEIMPRTRSFLCNIYVSRVTSCLPVVFTFRLLRVLDVLVMRFNQFPQELLQLVNLRYLALHIRSLMPDIFRLRNLETLLIRHESTLVFIASEIFDMAQLRHIKFMGDLPWFAFKVERSHDLQENIRRLSTIRIRDLIQVLERIPNTTKLGIYCNQVDMSCMVNLTCLRKLEILKLSSELSPDSHLFLSNLTLPHSLRKLTLRKFSVCLKEIGMLPNLEILRIQECTFEGSTWEPSEGEFCRLQFLFLEKLDLVDWFADQTHFPVLQKLVIRCCYELNEIPSDIGEIPTLEMIQVDECGLCVAESARQIQEEQLGYGNTLQVRISGSSM